MDSAELLPEGNCQTYAGHSGTAKKQSMGRAGNYDRNNV